MGLLLWWILGAIILTGGVIVIAVQITRQAIKDLMNSDQDGFNTARFAEVIEKKLDGEHTVVKVRLTDYSGNKSERVIKSTQGATVYVGETIYS